jgi:hypothetical protein
MIAEEMNERQATRSGVNEYYAAKRRELCGNVRLGFSG